MIEVGTEASGRHVLGERPVGGGHDPHRDLALSIPITSSGLA
jgi:hypothetical protein